MYLLNSAVAFDWDALNAPRTGARSISTAEAEQVFFAAPLIVAVDDGVGHLKPRWHVLGRTLRGRLLHLNITVREDGRKIRVISARDLKQQGSSS